MAVSKNDCRKMFLSFFFQSHEILNNNNLIHFRSNNFFNNRTLLPTSLQILMRLLELLFRILIHCYFVVSSVLYFCSVIIWLFKFSQSICAYIKLWNNKLIAFNTLIRFLIEIWSHLDRELPFQLLSNYSINEISTMRIKINVRFERFAAKRRKIE